MDFRNVLEFERTVRTLNEQLKDKPEGYATELNINGRFFSGVNDHTIEIILLDPRNNLVAYRPHLKDPSHKNNEGWFFGDYTTAVKYAFERKNRSDIKKEDKDGLQSPREDTIDPEYTLMGFF